MRINHKRQAIAANYCLKYKINWCSIRPETTLTGRPAHTIAALKFPYNQAASLPKFFLSLTRAIQPVSTIPDRTEHWGAACRSIDRKKQYMKRGDYLMADIFRITDRFKINGIGIVYTIKISRGAVLRLGDLLSDLRGNRFRVSAVEMCEGPMHNVPFEERTVGIRLQSAGSAEAVGSVLVRALTDVNYLFCSHPLYPRRADEDYENEYREAGLRHSCALFSYEDLEKGKLSLYGREISGLTIYRGWMMKPAMYRDFYKQLEKKGIVLINTPEEYERYHLLPGWYNDFKNETAESLWTSGNRMEDVLHISMQLTGSYIIKDYVKSRKHEWYDACFIPDIQDKNTFKNIVGNFIDRQGTELAGGVVLRKYENLRKTGFHERSGMPLSEEYRVFIYAGGILTVDDYWMDNPEVSLSDDEYQWIESVAARVKSNFVTMDLARKENGSLTILEFGDGQVSGLQQLKADAFYRAFPEQDMDHPHT